MYTTCCLMVLHPCAKFGMPMSKSKDDLAQTHSQGHTEFMNVCDTLSHGYALMAKYGPNTKPRENSYKFDLEVKGQH